MAPEPAMIRCADFAHDLEGIRALIHEYAAWLGFDLAYQGFDDEMARLPEMYGAPNGMFFVAIADAVLAGCVGVRWLTPDTGEMKRLYVRPAFRGRDCGADLVHVALAGARGHGMDRVVLDIAPKTAAAIRLYEGAGFVEIPPYYDCPLPGTRYFARDFAV
ncbi:MAG: GNAT family N-acetyltransferase [Pseudomonadota bacterium]